MLTIGVDPGLTKANPCGVAIIDGDDLAHYECITPTGEEWYRRVMEIARRLRQIQRLYAGQIGLWAWETPPYVSDYQVMSKLSTVGGVVLGIAGDYGLPAIPVSPAEGKQALTGDHRSDKAAMIAAVYQEYRVVIPKDAADAVGIALSAWATYHRQQLIAAAS